MLNWKTKYYISLSNDLENKYEKYVEKINSYKHIKITTQKFQPIKKQKDNNLMELVETYQNSDKIKKLYKLQALDLLKIEADIIKNFKLYALDNHFLDYKFFNKIIIILLNISEILRKRLKLEKFNKNKSSYKFCNFKDSCVYNYGSHKNKCYADHYVHHKVSNDLFTNVFSSFV